MSPRLGMRLLGPPKCTAQKKRRDFSSKDVAAPIAVTTEGALRTRYRPTVWHVYIRSSVRLTGHAEVTVWALGSELPTTPDNYRPSAIRQPK